MKINIVAVGKIKERFYTDAVEEYLKRISRFASPVLLECPEFPPKTQSSSDISQSLSRESEKILERAKGFVVLCAIDGENLSSEQLSGLIEAKKTAGFGELTFIIGGSNGVSEEVSARADFKLSFGRATYPHQLMRVILAEQIYRALTISNGLPYHK